jgi:hypothetical protein
MRELGGKAVGSDQGMGQTPRPSFELPEGLRQPPGEGQIIESPKRLGILLPQQIQR